MSEATGAVRGEVKDERVARRIEQFKRKCGEHGEEALNFAYHAALPVALNPEFLHLLRINFFVDIERPLPYEVEYEFLLSSLCRQIDEGLYEVERDMRLVLLEGLAREFGQERMREVAMLLWEYVEQHGPWAGRVGLERAQQFTTLSFLAEQESSRWLNRLETITQAPTSLSRDWLIAMQVESEQVSDLKKYAIKTFKPPEESRKINIKTRRILILAEPSVSNKIWLDEDIEAVENVINMQNSSDQFELRKAWVSNIQDIVVAVLDNRPEIIHFSGYFPEGDGLILRNSSGKEKPVSLEDIDRIFTAYNQAKCVILSSDNASVQATAIACYVECVIYPESSISGEVLVAFSAGFYQAIANGRSHQQAYIFGSDMIRRAGLLERLKVIHKNQKINNVPHSSDSTALFSSPLESRNIQKYLRQFSKKIKESKGEVLFEETKLEEHHFDMIAKKNDIDIPIKIKAEAFFLFSRFDFVQLADLEYYPRLCTKVVQKICQTTYPEIVLVNDMPSRICFSILIVDTITADVRQRVMNHNPFSRRVDVLWYGIPVVLETRSMRLHYYKKDEKYTLNSLGNIEGEYVWKGFWKMINQFLEHAS